MYQEKRNFWPYLLIPVFIIAVGVYLYFSSQKIVKAVPDDGGNSQRVIFTTPMPTPTEIASQSATLAPTKGKEATPTVKPSAKPTTKATSTTVSPTIKATATPTVAATKTPTPTP